MQCNMRLHIRGHQHKKRRRKRGAGKLRFEGSCTGSRSCSPRSRKFSLADAGRFSLPDGLSQPAGYARGSNPFGCSTALRLVC